MITNALRLEFQYVFPEEEQKDIIEYLKLISRDTLLNIIGFSNTIPQPNFDNFSSNLKVRQEITSRVIKYTKENNIKNKPILVTRRSSLKLAEIILSNREELINNNSNSVKNIDKDEINLLKAFLVINKEADRSDNLVSSNDNFDKMVDLMISMTFPIAELGLFENSDWEFGKLLYSTVIRFEHLIEFLKSNNEYEYLEKSLFEYFNLENSQELLTQLKYFFAKLIEIKFKNGFKFQVEDEKALLFLNSLVSNEITDDEDFTNLKIILYIK